MWVLSIISYFLGGQKDKKLIKEPTFAKTSQSRARFRQTRFKENEYVVLQITNGSLSSSKKRNFRITRRDKNRKIYFELSLVEQLRPRYEN